VGFLRTGSISLGPGATLGVALSRGTASPRPLEVTGGVTLSGAQIFAQYQVIGPLALGESITIIANDGTDPVVGTFAGTDADGTVAAGGVRFRIDYAGGDGNDVVLTRVKATAAVVLRGIPRVVEEGARTSYGAFVPPGPGYTGTTTGWVGFLEGSASVGGAEVRSGLATGELKPLAAGYHSIVASYGGNQLFLPATAPFTVRVDPMKPTAVAATGKESAPRRTGRKAPKRRYVAFVVRFPRRLPAAATVSYATRDGSAKAGRDYVATKGKLAFKAGRSRARLLVPIVADDKSERPERFTLHLKRSVAGKSVRSTAIGTITDDD
jgi:hypothetical protein